MASRYNRGITKFFSCIIIHGWGSHALAGFQSSGSKYVWIRDSLPKRFPKLRIWTYGYRASLNSTDDHANVYEYAETFRLQLRILRTKTKVCL